MKKIVMLNCMKLNEICTGASCMKAFNTGSAGFEQYGGEELELAAFMRCNGCDSDVDTDTGMREKIDRIKSIRPDAVHVGICTRNEYKVSGEECPTIAKLLSIFENDGIRTVRGTH